MKIESVGQEEVFFESNFLETGGKIAFAKREEIFPSLILKPVDGCGFSFEIEEHIYIHGMGTPFTFSEENFFR